MTSAYITESLSTTSPSIWWAAHSQTEDLSNAIFVLKRGLSNNNLYSQTQFTVLGKLKIYLVESIGILIGAENLHIYIYTVCKFGICKQVIPKFWLVEYYTVWI